MKSTIIRGLSLILIIHFSVYANEGNEGGHGGDPLAIEFISRGHEIVALLKGNPRSPLNVSQISKLESAVKNTPIVLVESLEPDPVGGLVIARCVDDSKSASGKTIQLWKEKWKQTLQDSKNVNRLVFHEYLRAIGLGESDKHYEISLWMNGSDNRTPKKLYMDEFIYGELIPFDGPMFPVGPSYDWKQWSAVEWGTVPGESLALRKQSEESHERVCTKWKEEVRKQLGKRLLRITCGEPETFKASRATVNSNAYLHGVDFIGFVTQSKGKILISTSEDLDFHSELVNSKSFIYDFNNFNSVVSAYKDVSKSFSNRCEEAKNELANQFASRLLYISPLCTNVTYRSKNPIPYIVRSTPWEKGLRSTRVASSVFTIYLK